MNINVIFLSTNLRTRPRKSAVVTQNGPHNPLHKLDLYESANMRRRSSPCWYCHSKFSPHSSIRPLLRTVMLTEEATVTEMFINLHRVSFSWDNVLGQRLLIYIYVYISFWYFLNAYIRSTTVWTPHVNFSDKEVNAPGEIFPAP